MESLPIVTLPRLIPLCERCIQFGSPHKLVWPVQIYFGVERLRGPVHFLKRFEHWLHLRGKDRPVALQDLPRWTDRPLSGWNLPKDQHGALALPIPLIDWQDRGIDLVRLWFFVRRRRGRLWPRRTPL